MVVVRKEKSRELTEISLYCEGHFEILLFAVQFSLKGNL